MGLLAGNPIQAIKKFGPELIECLPFLNFHRILVFMNPGNKYTCQRIELDILVFIFVRTPLPNNSTGNILSFVTFFLVTRHLLSLYQDLGLLSEEFIAFCG